MSGVDNLQSTTPCRVRALLDSLLRLLVDLTNSWRYINKRVPGYSQLQNMRHGRVRAFPASLMVVSPMRRRDKKKIPGHSQSQSTMQCRHSTKWSHHLLQLMRAEVLMSDPMRLSERPLMRQLDLIQIKVAVPTLWFL